MDPRTSEVLAMANWPAVDPYELDEAKTEDLQNMATSFTFEPGSTFKAFTVAGALEEGLVKPSTPFDLPPTITVADRTIEEAHARGPMTLTRRRHPRPVLERRRGDDRARAQRSAATTPSTTGSARFGFGEPTGIDFPGEEQGIVLPPDEYSGSRMGNLPIGQGLAVTPIQMASRLRGDRQRRRPAHAAADPGGGRRAGRRPTRGERVISEQNAARLREMLEGVLEAGGTASAVQVPGYVLAGKTGTAQKVVDGTYSETEYVGSFVGFAPAEDPRLLVSVVVDDPPGQPLRRRRSRPPRSARSPSSRCRTWAWRRTTPPPRRNRRKAPNRICPPGRT